MISNGDSKDRIVQMINSDLLFDKNLNLTVDKNDCSIFYFDNNELKKYSDSFLGKKSDTLVLIVSKNQFPLKIQVSGFSLDKQPIYGTARVLVKVSDDEKSPILASRLISNYKYLSPIDRNSPLREVRFEDLEDMISSNISPIIEDVFSRYSFEQITSESEKKQEIRNVIASELKGKATYLSGFGLELSYSGIDLKNAAEYSETLINGFVNEIEKLQNIKSSATEIEILEIDKKIALLQQKIDEERSMGVLLRQAQYLALSENKSTKEILDELSNTTVIAERILKNRHALEYMELTHAVDISKLENQKKLDDELLKQKIEREVEETRVQKELLNNEKAFDEATKKQKLRELEEESAAKINALNNQKKIDDEETKRKLERLKEEKQLFDKQIESIDLDLAFKQKKNDENLAFIKSKHDLELEHLKTIQKIEEKTKAETASITEIIESYYRCTNVTPVDEKKCIICGRPIMAKYDKCYKCRNGTQST